MAINKADWLNDTSYDLNRHTYYSERERYEKELYYRRQEEEYRKAQQAAYYHPTQQAVFGQLANTAPKPDLNDPLAFLQNTDKKLLLTGEMQ